MKLEELKILRLACLTILGRGLETLLVRETTHSSGVSDNTILNRKISPEYWRRLFNHLRAGMPGRLGREIFDERAAGALWQSLCGARETHACILAFIRSESGTPVCLPADLLGDGNFLFSLGTVYSHRFFRLTAFFNRYWGRDEYEPAIRTVCQKLWFFYLISAGKLRVSRAAFEEQHTDHEAGIFTFIIQDFRTFAGILHRAPEPIPREAVGPILELANVPRTTLQNDL